MKKFLFLILLSCSPFALPAEIISLFDTAKVEKFDTIEDQISTAHITGSKSAKSATIFIVIEKEKLIEKATKERQPAEAIILAESLAVTNFVISQLRAEGYSLKSTQAGWLGTPQSIVLFFEK